jgi:hypothetical protein
MFKNLNIFRPILVILILFIPLYPKFPLASVTGTYVAIRLDDIVIAISLLIWAIYQLKHRFPVLKNPISKLFIAYFIAIITSNLLALLIYKIYPQNILLLHLFRRFEYMLVFFLALDSLKSKKDLILPYLSLIIATISVSLYALGQKYFSLPVVSTMNSEFSKGQLLQLDTWTRVSSTFAGHYDLAAFLSVALILILGIALLQKNIFAKIGGILVWLFGFYILTLTASRVSVFAYWGGIVLTLVLIRKYLWIFPASLLVILSIFNSPELNQRLIATLNTINIKPNDSQIVPTAIPTVIPQVTSAPINPNIKPTTPTPTVFRHGPLDEYIPVDTDAGVARSGEIRFNAEWPRAITAFNKNRLTGSGLGSITLATDNDYLRLLGESGILGFLTFMAIQLFFIFKSIPRIFGKQSYLSKVTLIFLGALITMLANATLIDVFEASKTAYLFWIMMAVYYQVILFQKNGSKK